MVKDSTVCVVSKVLKVEWFSFVMLNVNKAQDFCINLPKYSSVKCEAICLTACPTHYSDPTCSSISTSE